MNCPICNDELGIAQAELIYDGMNSDGDFRVMKYLTKAHCDRCQRNWRRIESYEMRRVSMSDVEEDLAF